MPEKKWDAIIAGDIFIDLILSGFASLPSPGQEAFAKQFVREAGGGAAITACGLAMLDLKVALAGVAGADGSWLIERLRGFNVDTRQIRSHPAHSTGLTVSVSSAEDRAFFTYPGANLELPDLLKNE